jgi:hypothetical protein
MKDLDSLLREDARTLIADDGFAARVTGALPPPPRAAQPWLRPALVFGSAALGSVLAVAFAPAGSVMEGFVDLVQLHALTPASIGAIAIGAALTISGLVLAFDADS